ncbi:hypothetical protein LTR36_004342 [Oleoguttula mirabilis]|uniref:Zn(2)-C6 fungal-type domain-containing protein n=1 Tax=Oleoguttula mirabilis TaxID=1507867 RepID=A0AAV9JGZ2_9PEZI|nr:hypothetical protein LTR36_004342 [Oleoguttula mirabilis]
MRTSYSRITSAYLQPGFTPSYVSYDSNTISPTSSEAVATGEQYGANAGQKRKEPPQPTGSKPAKKVKRVGPRSDSKAGLMANGDGDKEGEGAASKPKRVRTGCLTCRERHLKCDEAMPHCNNCKKSNRTCKRGVRLNFIDTWAERPPNLVTLYGTKDWKVEFLDESREIASEYQGGMQKYKHLDRDTPPTMQPEQSLAFDFATIAPPAPNMAHQPLPPIQGILPETYPNASLQQPPDMSNMYDPQIKQDPGAFQMPPPNSGSTSNTHYGNSGANSIAGHGSVTSYSTAQSQPIDPDDEKKEYLENPEETLFMQVFVEEVGLWMDSMDPLKHFSRLLPFHSLGEPMLLNAFLACGARHLTLVNPAYTEEKALHYYDTATRHLLKNLQNPNRDTVICATTAVILNVYEIMSERALQRMNHIAGARALIKECGWNARAQGIGSACFWLNVGLEVLSCLHFNWQVAWNPDDWLIDMDLSRETYNGREESWTHKMLYIVAKVCNFRATIPRQAEADHRDEQIRTQHRYEEWSRLKGMVDAWNDGIPRTMQAMAYVHPQHGSSSKSAFPEVWLVKRTTIVARLLFHTAQLLLAQIHPYYGSEHVEMKELQRRHSQAICGIAAHVKDRGVASVALRSLAHAAEVLTDRREQDEVLGIFEKINKETGWRIGFIYKELKEKWGWNEEPSPQQFAQTHTAARQQKEAREAQQRQLQEQAQAAQSMQLQQGFGNFGQQNMQAQVLQQAPLPPPQPMQPAPPPTPQKKPPAGIPNPMYAKADFNLPQHPYQNFYVAPNAFANQQGGGMYYNF